MSHDFRKKKKKMVMELYLNKKEFSWYFRKIVGWIKVIVKVKVEIVRIICNNLETLAKHLWNFWRNFIDVCKNITLANVNNISTKFGSS